MIHTNDINLHLDNSVVCIGNFDGFHLGHRKIIERLKQHNLNTVLISFTPHPIKVLKDENFKLILNNDEKLKIINNLNIDYFFEINFDKNFASHTSNYFFENILQNLNCKYLILGEDSVIGSDRANIFKIKQLATMYNIHLEIIQFVTHKNEKISSNKIKNNISNGIFNNDLLDYFILGKVVKGKKLARTLGFPTANVYTTEDKIIPKNGVYKTTVTINNKIYRSITNIGVKPTINSQSNNVVIETHIFDFDEYIYDEYLEIRFLEFMRDEQKFNSIEELKLQIKKDCDYAQK